MDSSELEDFQNQIKQKIYETAEENGLLSDGDEPLYDGFTYASEYCNSDLKILWILKEAYDNNYNGGWSITEQLFSEYPYTTKIKNPTHQKMAYVSYGILNKCNYEDIDYLSDNPSIGEVLHEIAYINLNKMPAGTSTDNDTLWEKYETWKDILWEQIYAYNPDVIIFGNTFQFFKNDFFNDDEPDWDYDYSNGIETEARANVCKWNDTLLIDTNHPQWTECQGSWANAIIHACQDYFNY